jgi:hypothetical protein
VAFFLVLKVKYELASRLLTQGTFKKSSKGVTPTISTEDFAAAFLQ